MVSQRTRRVITLSTLASVLAILGVWALVPKSSTADLFHPPSDMQQLIEETEAATFEIFCEEEDEYGRGGTGWHLQIGGDNYVITNAHVIDACIGKNDLYIYDHTREPHATEILGYRHTNDYRGSFDIAVLRGRPDIPTLKLSADEPLEGHWAMVIGWPVIQDYSYRAVIQGHITGVPYRGDLISDLDTHGGTSGSALVNSKGEVIGTHYAGTPEYSKRSLSQDISRLCGVAVVCDKERKPVLPLQFPEKPFKTYIPDQEE